MKILCDTLEKENEHILQYFREHGIDFEERRLETADYRIEGRTDVAIDRKKDLGELCKNLTSTRQYASPKSGKKRRSDKARFKNEVIRAYNQGMRLIVLIEHGACYKSIEDVAKWKNKYGMVQGRKLMDLMEEMHIAYGVEFLFCDKRSTARRIIELLHYE